MCWAYRTTQRKIVTEVLAESECTNDEYIFLCFVQRYLIHLAPSCFSICFFSIIISYWAPTKKKHCPWHTVTHTYILLGHKWSCLTTSLMSSLRALPPSVKSEVWILQDPRGQRCITMTSANKLLEHTGGGDEHTGAHTQSNTHKQSNISWSGSFMSQCVSVAFRFMSAAK